MKAQLPNNEAARLATLRGYNVLDTLPEQAFDDLTLIAKQICQTPMALITLIDEDRQWFKSRIGVGLTETPRDVSFCSHAILNGDSLFEVPNAHIDPRFCDNPLVTGEPYVVFYAGAPLLAPDGSALGTLCVLDVEPRELNDAQRFALQALSRNVVTLLELERNIAMRKQAEQALRESEERYRDLLENANVPIQSVALDGSFLYVNRAWRETFAYSEADIPSLLLQNIIHPVYLSYCLEIFRRVTTQDKPDLAQAVFLTKDGREVMVEGTSSCRFIDGKPVSTRTILRDITEQKRAERLLQERNEELKSFAYTVSHDLKAPLRGISGYAQELDRRHLDGLSERAKFCIAQIITASKNLDNLIEDLLKYSRLDAENPTQSEIQLLDFIQKILHDRSHTLTELGVVTTLNVAPLTLITWERGLHQVLTNLIDNAIKYSRQSQPPRLTISTQVEGGRCRLSISDNGIGFDMKYHDRIYGLFNRLVRASDFEGTGVGLAIVKKLTEKIGGKVYAEATLGQGATFFVEFPLSVAPVIVAESYAASSAVSKGAVKELLP